MKASLCKKWNSFVALLTATAVIVSACFHGGYTVKAAKEELAFDFVNVEAGETEYEAFVRIGGDFYDAYIKDKYISTAAKRGLPEKVFTLDSIFAMEYAINKDFLSDETISKITSGSTKLVDLNTYVDTLNVFCAESCEVMSDARRSTDAPDHVSEDAPTDAGAAEWASKSVNARGITVPDFDKLSFLGYDPLGSSGLYEYLYHYANMGRGGLRDAAQTGSGKLVNADGNLILGWGKLANGDITVQGSYTFGYGTLCNLYNASGCAFVISDNRYYVMKNSILQTENLKLNFAKDVIDHDLAWYDEVTAEDRDIDILLDQYHGVNYDDFMNQIGRMNSSYLHKSEGVGFQMLFYALDTSLPIYPQDEASQIHRLASNSETEVSLKSLETARLSVSVENDTDGWYGEHVRFVSSNPDVVYVDQMGTIYGITSGNAVITAFVKSAGRSVPIQFQIHVTDSPNTDNHVQIGFFSEDALYLGGRSDVMFDSLASNMEKDGGAAITLYEEPIFYVNGKMNKDSFAAIGENDSLSLDRWTQTDRLGTMPFEDYKRLADILHANGKKLYIFFQSYYAWDRGESIGESSYPQRMIAKYSEDKTDPEAATYVEKLMNAYKEYFLKYGAEYAAAGVDGIFVNDSGGGYRNDLLNIEGKYWKEVIDSLRSVYPGEILAYVADRESTHSLIMESEGLLSNVDVIHISAGWDIQDIFDSDNPSVEVCKKLIQDRYGTFCDAIYEKYHKPISMEWWITSTDHPANAHVINAATWCRGKCGSYKEGEFSTDANYLQQMIVWEALLELFSEKEYTYILFTRYAYQFWKINNTCYDLESGYDCSGSVYKKPAARLLKAWSTGQMIKEPWDGAGFQISIDGEGVDYGHYVMKEGDTVSISVEPTAGSYVLQSSDESVVSVDGAGTLTAKAPGKAMVHVINHDDLSRMSVTVYVLPSSTLLNKIRTQADSFVSSLTASGYDMSQTTFQQVYELAVRINEPVLSVEDISALVDGGIFKVTSNKQYSDFVYSLKDYPEADISTLCLSENTGCGCTSNEEFIKKYIVKDPFNSNFYPSCKRVEFNMGEGMLEWELQHEDCSPLFGWGAEGDLIAVQAVRTIDGSNQAMYVKNAIQTGDRIYFADPFLAHDSVTLTIDGEEVNLSLEEDGGIRISDFKAAVGEDFYAQLLENCKSDSEGYYIAGSGNHAGFFFILSDMGYPTESIFDFECQDVVYDGNTSLEPVVIKNYSEGDVTFYYRNILEKNWDSEAPVLEGEYEVRGEVWPQNGYRKQIVTKKVKITGSGSQITEPAPGTPQKLSVVQKGAVIEITWEKSDGGNRYKIYRRYSSDEEWRVIGYSAVESYEDKEIECNRHTEYAVSATALCDTGELSEPFAITTNIHHIVYVEGKSATASEPGCIPHYQCEYCGALFKDEQGTTEISEEAVRIDFAKYLTAELYADASFDTLKEQIGVFENTGDLEDAISGKEGYLKVILYSDAISAIPGQNEIGIKAVAICSDEAIGIIKYTGEGIELKKDLYVLSNITMNEKGVTIKGNHNRLYFGGLAGGQTGTLHVSGGTLKTTDLSICCAGQICFDADVDGVRLLTLNEWIGSEVMTEENVWAEGNLRFTSGSLIINSDVQNVGELQEYGNPIYLQGDGALSVDSVTGIYGDIYLQQQNDGTLSTLSVNETIKDMIWQLRLYVYESLNAENLWETAAVNGIANGTVLAYLPPSADASCMSKLGFMTGQADDWSYYKQKMLLDNRLYYSDGSGVIEHLWEGNHTVDAEATCGTVGRRSIHCSVCDAVKDETEIPATGKHDFGDDSVCIVCGFVKELPEGLWCEEIPDYVYTGKAVTPEPVVYHRGTRLVKGKDYVVSYQNNVNAGKAAVKIKGKGNFTGTVTKEFAIKEIALSNLKVPAEMYAAFTGKVIKPALAITDSGKTLKTGKDYEIEVKDSKVLKEVGDYILTVTGKENYGGTIEIPLHITLARVAGQLTVSRIAKQNYDDGKAITPAVTVKDGRNTLTLGTHYELEYSDNCTVGMATVTVIGKGDYVGTKTVPFQIVGTSIGKARVEGIQNLTYTGGGLAQSGYTVSLKGKPLVEGTDFTVSYINNVRVGKATMIFTGKGGYTGTLKKTFRILPYGVTEKDAKVSASASDTPYAKGGAKAVVSVTFASADGERTLSEGVDYTVTYRDNKAIAAKTADKVPVAVVKFKGNFSGTRKLPYTISTQDIGALSMVAADKKYTAKENTWKQKAIKIFDVDGRVLKAGVDYDKNLIYTLADGTVLHDKSDVPANTEIFVTAKGLGNYADSQLVGSYRIVTALISGTKVVIAPVEYDGTAKEPKPESIEIGKEKIKLTEGTDYVIIGYSNNVNKGTANATIRGIGSYGGTKVVKFKIQAKTFFW